MQKKSGTKDEFAVLAAIWILACNDEIPVITYRGIRHRLNLPDNFDLNGLVLRHGELFRLGIPPSRLKDWKADLRAGRHMPSWIREVTGSAREVVRLIDLGRVNTN